MSQGAASDAPSRRTWSRPLKPARVALVGSLVLIVVVILLLVAGGGPSRAEQVGAFHRFTGSLAQDLTVCNSSAQLVKPELGSIGSADFLQLAQLATSAHQAEFLCEASHNTGLRRLDTAQVPAVLSGESMLAPVPVDLIRWSEDTGVVLNDVQKYVEDRGSASTNLTRLTKAIGGADAEASTIEAMLQGAAGNLRVRYGGLGLVAWFTPHISVK